MHLRQKYFLMPRKCFLDTAIKYFLFFPQECFLLAEDFFLAQGKISCCKKRYSCGMKNIVFSLHEENIFLGIRNHFCGRWLYLVNHRKELELDMEWNTRQDGYKTQPFKFIQFIDLEIRVAIHKGLISGNVPGVVDWCE